MALTSSITKRTVMGDKRVNYGLFVQENLDTGGDIATGLSVVHHFNATGALTATNASGTVTITTADPGAGGQTGYWMAIGY